MDTIKAISSRMSIRSYKSEQIKDDDLTAILRAGQCAPSAGVIHFSVIQDRNLIEEISEAGKQFMLNGNEFSRSRASLDGYTPLYHAPTFIAISGPDAAPFSAVNAALAIENMMIAATDFGYGTCYLAGITGMINSNENMKKIIGIPDEYSCCCGLIIGYTDDVTKFSPNPRPAKRTDNVNFVR